MTTLQILIVYLCMGTAVISLFPRHEKQGIHLVSLTISVYFFFMCLSILYCFDPTEIGYQFRVDVPLIPEYSLSFSLGVDGFSLPMLLLTAYIMPICIYAAEPIENDFKDFIVYLLLIELCLVLTFLSINAFFFYVFFESVLIPMYLLIGKWGTRERRINAGFYFFLYTLFGSFFLLFGILYLYQITGSLDNDVLLYMIISHEDQKFLFLFFFIPFAIKIPMVPFHIWLPEAHVEAPTIGSVILASLLLKLGGYGFIRYTVSIVPAGCDYFNWLIYGLAVTSIIYASLSTIRQNDLKRIIAYSSVAHMNLVVIGIFSFTHQGLDGAMYLMISHGIVSGGLFFCVGVLYDRYQTRSLRSYSGLVQVMPLFCMFFFVFTCANMSFPATANFIGEFLIFTGTFDKNSFIMFLCASSIYLSAVYSIWLFNRISFGTLKIETEIVNDYADINVREYIILLVLLLGMIGFGIYSSGLTDITDTSIENLLVTIESKR